MGLISNQVPGRRARAPRSCIKHLRSVRFLCAAANRLIPDRPVPELASDIILQLVGIEDLAIEKAIRSEPKLAVDGADLACFR